VDESFEWRKVKCLRCGHSWLRRIEKPRICPNPKCHSPYWDLPPKVRAPREPSIDRGV